MAEEFLKVLMEKLSWLILREVGLIMGVDKEMKRLSSTLATIQLVLEDAEDKQFQSIPIQNWLSKLNDIAYETEDILDECATEFSKMEHKGTKFNLKKILFSRKIGRRMKQVTERLDGVAEERRNFHLLAAPQPREFDARRETGYVLKEPDHIYGRDEEREKIVDILVSQVKDCQKLSVLPILGVGGLGKTTLAQLVFNDERVCRHFDNKLWVYISDNFDIKILVRAMIESATGSAPALSNLEALQRRLREVLNHKRYLLILDDVWNGDQENWVMLKSILACGSKGASIVVTTRQKKVADIMGTLPAHRLKELGEEHCWSLFRLRAFGQEEDEEHHVLETIGRQIVKKCAGVPLTAKALGGLLRFKRNKREWIIVEESAIWNFTEEEASILPVLRLSYHHLPVVLRRCFVYCAVFPKGSVIDKESLIFHWMAHGCISSNERHDVEDVGDQMWNELVLRSLFQDVKTRGTKITFKMHDLVHDLAQSILESKIPGAAETSTSASNTKVREVHYSEYFTSSSSNFTRQVSTLATIQDYSRLRTLKLVGAKIEKLPNAMCKLKHLRYLNLSSSWIRTLPRTICDLWNLQILVLSYCRRLKSLPRNVRCMINLRHMFIEGCPLSHMPSGIRDLKLLKTLSLFIVGRGDHIDELEPLSLGGRLEIKHLERIQNHVNARKANLLEKPKLQDLVLDWEGNTTTSESEKMVDEKVLEALEPHPNLETLQINGFRGNYFPPWMKRMENVTKITIRNCRNCSFTSLGDLQHLSSLHLENLGDLEYIEKDENPSQTSTKAKFSSLKDLRLLSIPNLKGLLMEEAGEMFPNLQSIYVEGCQLLMLPPLPTVEMVEARKCSLLNLSSFSNLENLSTLWMVFDESDTTCMPEDTIGPHNLKEWRVANVRGHRLPEKWFHGLKSLTRLLMSCCNIASFPDEWLRHLTALEELRLHNSPELVGLPEDIKHLHHLKRLKLSHLDNIISLPTILQYVTSLEYVELKRLPQLTSLPEWLGNLTSLTRLEIEYCPKVSSLPSSIQGMKNLQSLAVWDCSQLAQRCENERGEDWHKIAHIPQLEIPLTSLTTDNDF